MQQEWALLVVTGDVLATRNSTLRYIGGERRVIRERTILPTNFVNSNLYTKRLLELVRLCVRVETSVGWSWNSWRDCARICELINSLRPILVWEREREKLFTIYGVRWRCTLYTVHFTVTTVYGVQWLMFVLHNYLDRSLERLGKSLGICQY